MSWFRCSVGGGNDKSTIVFHPYSNGKTNRANIYDYNDTYTTQSIGLEQLYKYKDKMYVAYSSSIRIVDLNTGDLIKIIGNYYVASKFCSHNNKLYVLKYLNGSLNYSDLSLICIDYETNEVTELGTCFSGVTGRSTDYYIYNFWIFAQDNYVYISSSIGRFCRYNVTNNVFTELATVYTETIKSYSNGLTGNGSGVIPTKDGNIINYSGYLYDKQDNTWGKISKYGSISAVAIDEYGAYAFTNYSSKIGLVNNREIKEPRLEDDKIVWDIVGYSPAITTTFPNAYDDDPTWTQGELKTLGGRKIVGRGWDSGWYEIYIDKK